MHKGDKISLNHIKYLLFDVDGTLIDTITLILETFKETFRILGIPQRSDEDFLSQVGRPLHLQARDIDPERAEEIFTLYRRLYAENHDALAREFPGVKEALRELHERGYHMAVVTSKRSSSTHSDLKYFDLDAFFKVIITADDTTRHKPDPEPVLKALQELGASAETATFIGDSPYDLRSAHAAEVAAGAVGWGPFPAGELEAEKPDFWVPTPSSLLDLFP